MAKNEQTIYVACSECGGGFKNHRVLYEKSNRFTDPDDPWASYDTHHQLIECMGCDAIKYRRFKFGMTAPFDDPTEYEVSIFPGDETVSGNRKLATFGQEEDRIPTLVRKIYKETVAALNMGARTLAGGGLRATVEAICLDQGLTQGTLLNKIDELVNNGRLTKSQADFLHEERYIGNAALHELETPSHARLTGKQTPKITGGEFPNTKSNKYDCSKGDNDCPEKQSIHPKDGCWDGGGVCD